MHKGVAKGATALRSLCSDEPCPTACNARRSHLERCRTFLPFNNEFPWFAVAVNHPRSKTASSILISQIRFIIHLMSSPVPRHSFLVWASSPSLQTYVKTLIVGKLVPLSVWY